MAKSDGELVGGVMAPNNLSMVFRGLCLSCHKGKKTNYLKFVTKSGTEFQVSCNDFVDPEDLQRQAVWTLDDVRPVSGVGADGKAYAYFKAEKIAGEYV